ncbi:MAG TPA: 16S rRNA (cytidine(1402)-2'-O)-methyltransferase [Bryobacteraceae bacterium]|nr:16S rRNA (cytidine(1402)-2'-O)-methyltransferase [Bryobacteraceae bacterium]
MAGTLYIVATPIGNLEDITLRGVRVLREVQLIACEDTRQTRKLLDHFAITVPLVSYHEHNEAQRAAELVEQLKGGQSIALVSDAGTPLVSDPGHRLVAAAIAAGVPVVPIPGASAVVSALSAAGLPADQFRFCGFLPAKSTQRRKVFEQHKHEDCTIIFYEAPHRILDALADAAEVFGSRRMAAARELTKIHEEFLRGSAAEIREQLASRPSVKGELTLLIAPAEPGESIAELSAPEDAVRALEKQGMPRMEAIKQVARERGLGKREVYRLVAEHW